MKQHLLLKKKQMQKTFVFFCYCITIPQGRLFQKQKTFVFLYYSITIPHGGLCHLKKTAHFEGHLGQLPDQHD